MTNGGDHVKTTGKEQPTSGQPEKEEKAQGQKN